ncbi:MDR family MFS transporter [Streptomyces fractus]|uniref:MDR family MFS transporter n=1 Tax=Streptomyces fractus TaxID=641806 RepID=UPI003CE97A54
MSSGTAPEAEETVTRAGVLTHRQIMVILSGLMLGMLLAALDQTIVTTSIRTIADDLDGLSQQAWVTTAYLITSTVTMPLYGKLSDLYGRKPFYLTAIGIFIAGSLACTISTSMGELAAFRAFQGLGAGGLMSLAMAIIGDLVPPRERARYQGYILAVFATSSVLGPLIGGFLAGQSSILGITGWRWVFFVNVPVGIVAFLVVGKVLNVPHTRREARVDWGGAATLVVTTVPLLLVAEQGRTWGWTSAGSISCYVTGAVGLAAWWLTERRMGDDALIPLRLFASTVFSRTAAVSFIIGMGMFGGMLMIPQYLQIVKGVSPTEAGLLTLPLTAGMIASSLTCGRFISRTGRYRNLIPLGCTLITTSMLLFYVFIDVDSPVEEAMAFMVLFGAGLGCCMQTLTLTIQNAVPPRDMGVATSSATFFRQIGATAGTAVFFSVLFGTVTTNIGTELQEAATSSASFQAALTDPTVMANPVNQAVATLLTDPGTVAATNDSSILTQMAPALARPFEQGFADSMHLVFLLVAVVVAIGGLLSLTIREVPLRTGSGLEDAKRDRAAEASEKTAETKERAED